MKRVSFGIIIIIIGVIVVLYPIVSNILTEFTQTEAILRYEETVSNMSDEELAAIKEAMKTYNSDLTSSDIVVSSDDDTQYSNYVNLLDVGEILGYVSIPQIDVYLPIYEGTSDAVLEAGVGHVTGSSFPIGEMGTHAVFAGHTGLVRAKMFDDLDTLEIGDLFYVKILDESYAYEVDQINIVEPDEVSAYTQIEEQHEYVTLVTCTPYGINTHRLLVRGTRVEISDDEETLTTELTNTTEDSVAVKNKTKVYEFIGMCLLIIVFIIIMIVICIRKKRKVRRY